MSLTNPITYTPRAGETISQTANRMVEIVLSTRTGLSPSIIEPATIVVAVFNDITLTATPSSTHAEIVSYYNQECDRRRQAYLASPEYARAQQERADREREQAEILATLLAAAPTEMTITNPRAWAEWQNSNTDGYGLAVLTYAQRWARLMEGEIATTGCAVGDCAQRLSHVADTEGITGFMYRCAVQVLASCWAHGEALRRWHNCDTQIDTEGDTATDNGGVLNPALLVIGGGK